MLTSQDIMFDDIVADLASLPKRGALDALSDRQLSNLIVVVRESKTELDAFIETIRAIQTTREDDLVEASTVSQ